MPDARLLLASIRKLNSVLDDDMLVQTPNMVDLGDDGIWRELTHDAVFATATVIIVVMAVSW